MSFLLTTYQAYQDYFQALCTAHKLLGANSYLFGEEVVAMNSGRGWSGVKLWLDEPDPAGVADAGSDNYLKKKKGSLFVGGAPASAKYADEQTKYKDCELIVEDLVSKLIQDNDAFTVLIEKGSIKYGRAEYMFSSSKFVGCRLDFTYIDPTGFPYTAENWNEPEP
jgi:hypothetical protein